MKLSFHGADESVTGSCHLIEVPGLRVLVDCGLIQGSRELEEDNAGEFGFEAASIDVVLLTHAHLDHTGRLPLLMKRGFRGRIVATAATRELARLVLLDAAHLQEEEARRRQAHPRRHSAVPAPAPLYSVLDALRTFDQFAPAVSYREPVDLGAGIRATFFDAGHILGSASVLVEATGPAAGPTVLYSGDIGNAGRPLLGAPQTPKRADVIIMESTYGDRVHRSFADSMTEFYAAITSTLARGGDVVIPTFALERAQDILYCLRQGIDQGLLHRSLPVFLDSPMAISVDEVFARYPECLSGEVRKRFEAGENPLILPGLHLSRDASDSMAINRVTGGAVIMAGSGMCTGGRVRYHLSRHLPRRESSVVFVGYAAHGTLARQIIDGQREVRLLGESVPVRAQIHTINGFSAHADQAELVAWHHSVAGVHTTYLTHGEPAAMAALAARLAPHRVVLPHLHQEFEL